MHDAALRRAAELTLENGYRAFRITPLYVESFESFAFTVIMLPASDLGAYDAAAILAKSGG